MRVIPRRRRERDTAMTVVEHLEELRKRLLISVVAIGLGSILGFVFYRWIFGFLLGPYRDALQALPPQARPPGVLARNLIATSPTEPFITFLKIGLFTGFFVALPIVLYQLWRFVTPGLTTRERRLAIPFIVVSLALFAAGVFFAFTVAPRGLRFLFSFGGQNLIPLLTVDRYLSFLMFLILAFGLGFEMPIVLLFLTGAGVIDSRQLRRWRRYALLGTAVFAAIATPTQDPYTMLLMWLPLYVLYEGAILVARLFKR
ncbi:MAG TPA: twin-arginine translocase subunit TatC [Actinomycetota bacterium]|nr:twin-arginine translocase subunit TatC [Actinomycetota bacterium]